MNWGYPVLLTSQHWKLTCGSWYRLLRKPVKLTGKNWLAQWSQLISKEENSTELDTVKVLLTEREKEREREERERERDGGIT